MSEQQQESNPEVGTKREAEDVVDGQDTEAKRQMTAPSAPAEEGAPPSPEPEDEGELPANWEKHVSKRTGKAFWYNSVTKERTWNHPGKPKPAAPASPDSPAGEPSAQSDSKPAGMPAPSNNERPDYNVPERGSYSGEHHQERQMENGGDRRPGPCVIHPLTRLPMRPGDTKCNHYVNHGRCKFGESCRFDHPPSCASVELLRQHAIPPGQAVPDGYALSGGLPVRPGGEICSFFVKTGMCKFGNACKYHHPAELQTQIPTIARMPQRGEGKLAPQLPTAMMPPVEVAMLGRRPAFGAGGGGFPDARSPGRMGGPGPMPFSPMSAPSMQPPPPQTPAAIPYPWELHHTDEGRPYFFHTITQISQWHPPPEVERARAAPQHMPYGGAAYGAAPMMGMPPAMGRPNNNPYDAATGTTKYPVRPGMSDCAFYIKTGICSYGENCKFNHPPDGRPSSDKEMYLDVYPQREGVQDCPFYMKTGECKYGHTCKYNHPPREQLGLPVREGRENCPFYMKTGVCSYGRQCKYNHPPDLNIQNISHHHIHEQQPPQHNVIPGYVPVANNLGPAPDRKSVV